MQMELIEFAGVAVGIQIVAETLQERELLRCLEGLSAEGDERGPNRDPVALFLMPKLPFRNVPDTTDSASV